MAGNAYAPPDPDVDRARPAAHAPGRVIALLYGSAVLMNVTARAVAYYFWPSLGTIATAAQYPLGLAIPVLAMAWLYAAWKGVPESYRGTISPRRAALTLLFPIYNAYWALAVNIALCDTLDAILTRAGSDRRAPRALAIVAVAVWLLSFVFSVAAVVAQRPVTIAQWLLVPAVTGGLWFAYAIQCDRARDAVARLGDRAALGVPRLSQLQRERGPGFLVVVVGSIIAVIVFLVIWQSLQPSERRRAPSAPCATPGECPSS